MVIFINIHFYQKSSAFGLGPPEHFDPEKPVQDFISGLLQVRFEAECDNDEERNALFSDDYFVNNIEDMFAAGYKRQVPR